MQRTELLATFLGLKIQWHFPCCILALLGTHSPFFPFLFLPFGMGVSTLLLFCHCILEEDKLFSGFTGLQMEKNFAPVVDLDR